MSFLAVVGLGITLIALLLGLYLYINDQRLTRIPEGALIFSPKRCIPESVRSLAIQLDQSPPISSQCQLPPKTGRKYIVVGGVSFSCVSYMHKQDRFL